MILDNAETRERRLITAGRLTNELHVAKDEDDWDQILHEQCGVDLEHISPEQSWCSAVERSFKKNHQRQVDAIQKKADVAAKMYTILEQEKALAEEEKLRIRDEKHKMRKARRLARRGMTESEIQEKLYPPSEKAVNYDAPVPTEDVTKQGHGKVSRTDTEAKRRVRGDGHPVSERLREASLRPKTEEEIIQIKEARARRKEEEARKKSSKTEGERGAHCFLGAKTQQRIKASNKKATRRTSLSTRE